MVLVFDLDDTLYDETTFVSSGFQAVARYLLEKYRLPREAALALMMKQVSLGRGRVFDDLLIRYGIYSKKLVKKCLSLYRLHQPAITLYPEADACLKRFSDYPKYIVTDGNKLVQGNKIKALGLEQRVKFCYITHRYGIKNAKPSPYCFQKICEREKVRPQEVIYVGDNPGKDFVGIKPLGYQTIRVRQGQYKEVSKPPEFEADFRIKSLAELDEVLLERIFHVEVGKE